MSGTRRTRSDGRETIALVKRHAALELETHGEVNFNLDRVLESSGVSRSSVYHHFGNRDGLIAVVMLEQSLQRIIDELHIVAQLADGATTSAEMFDVLVLGLTVGGTAEARRRRQRRISGFAAAGANESMRRALKEVQVKGTVHLTEILEGAAQRGLIAPSVPLRGIAYFIQSVLIGRIVTDIVESEEIDDEWLSTSLEALRALLGSVQHTDIGEERTPN
jgi:AcrR family transcriptional regulator